MFGIPAAERAALESSYEDRADVSRAEAEAGGNGIAVSVFRPVYTGIRCGFSYTGGDSSGQTEAQNEIQWDATLFASPELEILPGDRVTVYRLSAGEGLAFSVEGRPKRYATHQEIRLREEDIA